MKSKQSLQIFILLFQVASSLVYSLNDIPKLALIDGMHVAWELPSPTDAQGMAIPSGAPKIRGILVALHGCKHSGSDFWPKSSACPFCIGLPENSTIRKIALRRGYAFIAPDSFDRSFRCWTTVAGPDVSIDGYLIPRVLDAIIEAEGLHNLPIYALGASNGGAFALMLPHFLENLHGIVSQVRTVPPSWLQLPEDRKYPPTLFVHMPRDVATAVKVAAGLVYLQSQGVPAEAIEVLPHPITVEWLTSQAPDISSDLAAAILNELESKGLLDDEGYLIDDPRNDQAWKVIIRQVAPWLAPPRKIGVCRSCSPLAQILNLSYAKHEITSIGMDYILDWLESGGSMNNSATAEAAPPQPEGL